MKCPNCKNKGFRPSQEVPRPLKNLGDKQYLGSFITRRYVCLQCGYLFLSKEEFYRAVEFTGQQQALFALENAGAKNGHR